MILKFFCTGCNVMRYADKKVKVKIKGRIYVRCIYCKKPKDKKGARDEIKIANETIDKIESH